jgi:D-lactate dehydrogenase (cytochrome)
MFTGMAATAAPQRVPEERLEAALADLRALLGDERVATGADERRQHGTDESWHPPAAPDAVVMPRSTEETAEIVRACARHGVPIIPFGAGTSLEGHVAALRGGVSVDMREMDAVLRLSVEDLDVTVEAGVTRQALEAKLRPEGVFFPVDPGADATLGGMAATGASGTTSVRYGTMRENVLSLTVVTASGEVVRTRSRARKSSAGYDLTRLFVGSEGTLGLITELTLRVQPTPEAMSAAVCAFPALGNAVDCVIGVLQLGIPVARMELLDDVQMDAVNRFAGMDHAVAPTLFLEFHGSPAGVQEQAEEVEAIAAEHGAEGFAWAADETERRSLWRARHRSYEACLALRPGARAFATDACVPISRLTECIVETRRDIDETGLLAPIVGHVGDGNFHVSVLLDPDDEAEVARAVAFNERLVRRSIALGGTCSGEHGVGYGKAKFLELEHGPVVLELMRALKAAFDPQDLFNPGKITGGGLTSP